jgi:hypothetical protein
MGGGLLQLVAYGAQDVYLTGNPQITFFKVAYRRHTNFALEAIEQTFNGNASYGSRVTCQISRNGDLINRIYLQVKLPTNTGLEYVPFYGLRLLNYVEIEIGGQKIDKHYSHWLYIWNELSLPKAKRQGYNEMVGAYGRDTIVGSTLYIPLEFWFCRNIGLALPLIALQYHEVKVNINFESADNMTSGTATLTTNPFTATMWVDYIYLDTDERRRFAQLSHEYLIEQLQFTGQEAIASNPIKTKLNFNHPCKELIWFIAKNPSDANSKRNWFNYTTNHSLLAASTDFTLSSLAALQQADINFNGSRKNKLNNSAFNPVQNAKLVLNGNDRFYERPGRYFNIVQPYQHHENIPANAGINVYSFALKPEEHQPSGTLNMSRIDTAVLNLNFEKSTITDAEFDATTAHTLFVYAVNYNVLRILSGMGGLAYSN